MSEEKKKKEIPVRDEYLSDNPVVEEHTYICVICPQSCAITVGLDAQKQPAHVYGHTCKRGLSYATTEATNPSRSVTATIPVEGALEPLSVKTSVPVPKGQISEVLNAIYACASDVKRPVRVGDVLIARVCDTEADIVATKNLM